MRARDVIDGRTDGALEGARRAVQDAVRAAAAVPGARRWWLEAIPGGLEMHAEVGAGHDMLGARETRIAAGAGLFAVHLAVAASGVRPITTLLPRSGRAGVLAIVRHGSEQPPTPTERTLFAALGGAVRPEAVPASAVRPFLRRAAEAEGVWLSSAPAPGTAVALRAVLVGDLHLPDEAFLVLLASGHDLPVCQVRAGRAAQRVLLTAAALGHTGVVVAGPRRLVTSRRGLLDAGLEAGIAPQALLAIAPWAPAPD
jgi:hypothetical protein